MLGYDVLFQDTDVIWLRDPIPFFQNATAELGAGQQSYTPGHYDTYWSDDGNGQIR
jgi:hypothetical protein